MSRIKTAILLFLFLFSATAFAEIDGIPASVKQGESFPIKIVNKGDVKAVKAFFLSQKIALHEIGGTYKAIMGIPLDAKCGKTPLTLLLTGADGKERKLEDEIAILKNDFPTVWFWLKPAKKKLLLAKDLTQVEWAQIERTLVVDDPEQYWEGVFRLPVSGEASMYFGTLERVNKMPRGRHRGFDLAVPIGTPVKAANAGKIVFARKLQVFGGTMVVDHGLGVHTLYFHLSKFLSAVGDKASKGDIIALSGNSGASSGPHLHWGLSVHDLRVDPRQWTKVEM